MQIAMRDKDGELLRDEAIDRVEKNAGKDFMVSAMAALRSFCATEAATFTSSEWVEWAETTDAPIEWYDEPRALGALFRKAHREGLIEPTNEFRPSIEPLAHHRPSRVWRVKR